MTTSRATIKYEQSLNPNIHRFVITEDGQAVIRVEFDRLNINGGDRPVWITGGYVSLAVSLKLAELLMTIERWADEDIDSANEYLSTTYVRGAA